MLFRSSGFTEGKSFAIYSNEALRNRENDAIENDRKIGLLKIVKANPSFSTAYIVRSSDDIILGDYVGGSKAQARIAPPSTEAPTGGADSGQSLDKDFELDTTPPATPDLPEQTPTAPDNGNDSGELQL